MTILCDVCGKPVPWDRRGRPPKRHKDCRRPRHDDVVEDQVEDVLVQLGELKSCTVYIGCPSCGSIRATVTWERGESIIELVARCPHCGLVMSGIGHPPLTRCGTVAGGRELDQVLDRGELAGADAGSKSKIKTSIKSLNPIQKMKTR